MIVYVIDALNEDTGDIESAVFSSEAKAEQWARTFDPEHWSFNGWPTIVDYPMDADRTIH